MAKSIFEILDNLETETSVPGQNPRIQPHNIPREQLPDSATYEDPDRLLAWFKESGFLHAGLQKGVRAHLIDLRAAFKACKKDDVWTPDYGQANLDNYTWEVHKRPSQGKTVSKEQLKKTLANMSPEELKELLAGAGLSS